MLTHKQTPLSGTKLLFSIEMILIKAFLVLFLSNKYIKLTQAKQCGLCKDSRISHKTQGQESVLSD